MGDHSNPTIDSIQALESSWSQFEQITELKDNETAQNKIKAINNDLVRLVKQFEKVLW